MRNPRARGLSSTESSQMQHQLAGPQWLSISHRWKVGRVQWRTTSPRRSVGNKRTNLPGFPRTEETSMVVELSVLEPGQIRTGWSPSGQSAEDCARTCTPGSNRRKKGAHAHRARVSTCQEMVRVMLTGSPNIQSHHGVTPCRPIHKCPLLDLGDTNMCLGALQLPPQHISWQNF